MTCDECAVQMVRIREWIQIGAVSFDSGAVTPKLTYLSKLKLYYYHRRDDFW
jgi:hypothetical protein